MSISSGLGNALVPTSYGFRNQIINGNFMINQRGYTSGSNLASGSYGFDRWKSNYTNTTLTFTSAPQGQLVTISASGVIRQIVERANIVAGSYVLSWSGTATGRVYNSGASAPSYAVSPVSVYLDGTADVIVEFTPASGTATLGNVQLELGSRATPFENRPIGLELALCQRYYETSNGVCQVTAGATGFGGNTYWGWIGYKVEKRIALNLVTNSTSNGVRVFATDGGADYITMWKAATQYYSVGENFEIWTTQGFAINTTSGQTDAGLGRFYWNANAEL